VTTVLTDSTGVTTTPLLALGYETSRESANILHWILGRPDPDVTLRTAKLRRGTLRLLYADETSAARACQLHAAAEVWTLTDDDLPTANMRYVVQGTIDRKLDEATSLRWLVTIGYQEVS
jgi:hypothetical protein